mgnify:CR=1 FL=1
MNTQKDTLTEEQKADLRKKLMDWNTAKTCIRSYLTTPAKANRFFDRSYPCYKLYNTGLIVTFYLVLSENSDNIEILNIDDRLLHGWNVDIEALKQAAEIGDKARGYKVESLSDLIGEMGETVKSLLLTIYVFDIKEIFIVGHYDCGVALTSSKDILHNMRSRGVSEQQLKLIEKDFQVWLDPYTDPAKNVLTVIKKLKANPFIPNDIPIHGLIIDPHTGKLDLLADGYKET